MKYLKTGLFAFLLATCVHSLCAQTDSLLVLLNSPQSDKAKIDTLYKLSVNYAYTDQIKAKAYIHQAITLGQRLNHPDLGKLYILLGELYYNHDEFDSIMLLLPILFQDKIMINKDIEIQARELKGKFHTMKRENVQALKEFHLIKQHAEETENDEKNFSATVNIANVHLNASNLEEAMNYFQMARLIAERIDSKLGIGYCHYQMGLVGMHQKLFEQAFDEFILAEKIFSSHRGGEIYLYQLYYKTALVLQELNKSDEAIPYLNNSIKFAKRNHNIPVLADCYVILGEYFYDKNQPNYTLYLDSAQQLANDHELIGVSANIHHFQYRIAKAENKPEKALEHYQVYIKLKDSVTSLQNSKEVIQSEANIAISEVDQKIFSLKNSYFKFYVGTFVLGVFLTFIVISLRRRNKKSFKTRSNSFPDKTYPTPTSSLSNITDIKQPSHQSSFMNNLYAVIEAHYYDFNFGVDALSNTLGLSRSQLHRKVKEHSKYTPLELIRNCRLQKAQEMLLQENAQISSVALSVGFKNFSYFTKTFKEYVGVTPTEFILAKSKGDTTVKIEQTAR